MRIYGTFKDPTHNDIYRVIHDEWENYNLHYLINCNGNNNEIT